MRNKKTLHYLVFILLFFVSVTGTAFADAVEWVDSKKKGPFAYFLHNSTPRIEIYDMSQETWMDEILLNQIPTAFHVDDDYIFVAYGKTVFRYAHDGTREMHLGNFNSTVQALFTDYDSLFVFSQNAVDVINRTNGIKIDNASNHWGISYIRAGISHSPSTNTFFGRSKGLSPSDIGRMAYDDVGHVLLIKDSPHHGDYASATQTYTFPNGSKVVDSSGNIYNGTSLEYLNTFATQVDDIDFFGTDIPIVLSGSRIISFSSAFLKTGYKDLSINPQTIYVRVDNVIAFYPDDLADNGIGVEIVSLSELSVDEPGPPVDPFNLAFTPDHAFIDTDNVLFLFSKVHASIFRWDIATQEWLKSIPLLGNPDYTAYSDENNAIYTAYNDGTIYKVDMKDPDFHEVPFVNLPTVCIGMVSAGEHLVTSDYSGAWGAHTVFNRDGIQIDYEDWNYPLHEAVWSAAKRRIYHFRDSSSPNYILWESIDTNGNITGQDDSPYHSSGSIRYPIRVKPDGTIVLLGSGRIYDADTLEQLNTLSEECEDATWLNGELYTLGPDGITHWAKPTYSKGATFVTRGSGYCLMTTNDNALLFIYIDNSGIPRINVFDKDYDLLAPPVIKAPELKLGDTINSMIKIYWNDVGGEEDYILEQKIGTTGSWKVIAKVGMDVASYTDRIVNNYPNNVYYYRVKANNDGQESSYSNELKVEIPYVLELENGSVTPSVGNSLEKVTFTVNCFNQSRNSPEIKSVYIDGIPHEMNLVNGSAYNGTYSYQTMLSAGTHEYYYYFSDRSGSFDRLPELGSYTGPVLSIPFGEAIDDDNGLIWTSSGNTAWYSQSNIFYVGGDSVRSGTIWDEESSEFSTTVTGPCILSFFWKVSSEADYDYLKFYIDGVKLSEISGNVDWEQKKYQIKSGTHTLKWCYEKDKYEKDGLDAGWVDNISISGLHSYYIPVFKPTPGYFSGLGIRNLSSTENAEVEVYVYSQNGDLLTTETKTLSANGQDAFLVGTSLDNDGWIKITTDQALAGLNWLVHNETGTASFMASVPFTRTLSSSLLIPHVDQSGNWDEAVFLANPNLTAATVTLTYTNKDGVASTPYTVTIPANGSIEIAMGLIIGTETAIGGSVTISSTQDLTGFALFDELKTGNYSFAGINAVDISTIVSATNYYLPAFKANPDYWSGLAITNLSSTSSATVNVMIYNKNGVLQITETRTVPASGQDAFLVGTTLTSDGWIKVSTTQPLAGLNWLSEIGTGAKSFMASVPFTRTLSSTLLIPHVDQSANWDEAIFLANPNLSSATVTLVYSDKSGMTSTPYMVTIPANGSIEISMGLIVGNETTKGGSVTISSTQNITGFALFDELKTGNYSFAGINAVDISE